MTARETRAYTLSLSPDEPIERELRRMYSERFLYTSANSKSIRTPVLLGGV